MYTRLAVVAAVVSAAAAQSWSDIYSRDVADYDSDMIYAGELWAREEELDIRDVYEELVERGFDEETAIDLALEVREALPEARGGRGGKGKGKHHRGHHKGKHHGGKHRGGKHHGHGKKGKGGGGPPGGAPGGAPGEGDPAAAGGAPAGGDPAAAAGGDPAAQGGAPPEGAPAQRRSISDDPELFWW